MRLFLCGDVMTGRGIDQVLRHPGGPALYEGCVRDAREYVRLAECVNGPIAQPVDDAYVWGAALEQWRLARPDVRIVNLETSITRSDVPQVGKAVHYRMNPCNVGCLAAAGIDCCCLANNHVLDWGAAGLLETIDTLDAAGIAHAGAGRDIERAQAPVVLDVPGRGRVIVFAFGSDTSGIPRAWAAGRDRPGVALLSDLSSATADQVVRRVEAVRRAGDVVVASIHWGSNWGYDVPREQRGFAHRLLEAGVDVVHGHSSHHVKAMEKYRGRLILYGCGEFLNDYEGIPGHEAYRGDLCVMYFVDVDPWASEPVRLRIAPLQLRRFRLEPASEADAKRVREMLGMDGG